MRHRFLLFATGAALFTSGCERKDAFEMLKPPAGQESELRKLWALPDFTLTERSGKSVRLADLAGKVWIADFFYTTCPGPCPMLSSRLTDIQTQLGGEENVRLVSISTDPEKDTLEVLKVYGEKFKAGERWLFLTGDKQAIYELGNKGFKLSVAEDPMGTEPITHSTKLVLVDRGGVVRGFYEGVGEEGTGKLVRDVRRLLKEAP